MKANDSFPWQKLVIKKLINKIIKKYNTIYSWISVKFWFQVVVKQDLFRYRKVN